MCRPPALGSNESLEQAYREISRAGVGALELRDWPRSSHFLEHCTETEGGALLPRRFKTNPGVGVFRASSLLPVLHCRVSHAGSIAATALSGRPRFSSLVKRPEQSQIVDDLKAPGVLLLRRGGDGGARDVPDWSRRELGYGAHGHGAQHARHGRQGDPQG